MDTNIGISCNTAGVVNQEILLDEFLGVNKDVIVTEYPTDDEILYSVKKEKMEMSRAEKIL